MNCDNCELLEADIESLESEVDDLEEQIKELEWELDDANDEKRRAAHDASDMEDRLIDAQKLLGDNQEINDTLKALQDLGYAGSNTILGSAHFIRTHLIRRNECIDGIGAQPLENKKKLLTECVKTAALKFTTLLQRLKK